MRANCTESPQHAPLLNQRCDFGGERGKRGQSAQKAGDDKQAPLGCQAGMMGENGQGDADQVAANVPGGIAGNSALSDMPSSQRNTAPRDAPKQMANSELKINLSSPDRIHHVLLHITNGDGGRNHADGPARHDGHDRLIVHRTTDE